MQAPAQVPVVGVSDPAGPRVRVLKPGVSGEDLARLDPAPPGACGRCGKEKHRGRCAGVQQGPKKPAPAKSVDVLLAALVELRSERDQLERVIEALERIRARR